MDGLNIHTVESVVGAGVSYTLDHTVVPDFPSSILERGHTQCV